MDFITAEKLFAMNYYLKKRRLFLHYLILIVIFFSFLLCSQSYCFIPSNFLSSMKQILVIWASNFFSPRWLFIVLNAIIIYIIGELKFAGPKSSPATEMYEHCVERSRSLGDVKHSDPAAKKVEVIAEDQIGTSIAGGGDGEKEIEKAAEAGGDGEEEKQREEGEDVGLAYEELNRRADAFIARVNQQRRLDAMEGACNFW